MESDDKRCFFVGFDIVYLFSIPLLAGFEENGVLKERCFFAAQLLQQAAAGLGEAAKTVAIPLTSGVFSSWNKGWPQPAWTTP